MLVAAQYPLADVRLFLRTNCRCVSPVGFVRRSGKFDLRRSAPRVEWPDEDRLWLATRALRYEGEIARRELGSAKATRFQGKFRRLFWNVRSTPVTRVELGLSRVVPRRHLFLGGRPKLDADETRAVAHSFLALRMAIPGEGMSTALKAARPLARLIVRSTTAWRNADDGFAVAPWWVSAGHPLLMVVYSKGEAGEPTGALKLDHAPAGVALHHDRVVDAPEYCRIWFVGVDKGADEDQVRLLRLHLFRLNAELECLRLVLEHLADEERCSQFARSQQDDEMLRTAEELDVDVLPGGARSERLDRYLEKALGLLLRKSVYGHPPSRFLEQVYAYEREAAPAAQADLWSLIERAETCRPMLGTLRRNDSFRPVYHPLA